MPIVRSDRYYDRPQARRVCGISGLRNNVSLQLQIVFSHADLVFYRAILQISQVHHF